MNNLTIQQILARLSPLQPNIPIGISTTIIILLAIIVLLMQKIPSMQIQLMMTGVIIATMIDKIAVGQISGFSGQSISTLFLRVPIFIFPFISAGMMRKQNQKAIPVAIIGGVFGVVYVFLRWFFEMRG